MPTTFKRCDNSVNDLALEVLCEFETHKPLLDAKVKIDFVFAYGDTNEEGKVVIPALTLRGNSCLGICRKIQLKDRALGRGDAEISLDHDWWQDASVEEQKALLDHEMHHIQVVTSKNGVALTDDLMRPLLRLRRHDVEVGWFKIVADRHGKHSQERIQAAQLMESTGQYFWPEVYNMTHESGRTSRTSRLELDNS